MANNTSLRIADIIRDKELQGRDEHSYDHQADIAEHLKRGGKMQERPKVMKVTDRDNGFYLFDGFHTVGAFEEAGRATIPVQLFVGTWQECRDAAMVANIKHKALKRTRADKERVARMTLEDHPDWSDRFIAKRLAVSPELVKKQREHVPAAKTEARIGQDGKKRPMPPAKPKAAETTDDGAAAEVESAQTEPATKKGKKPLSLLDWKKHDECMGWLAGFISAVESHTQDRRDADEARSHFSAYLDNHAKIWRQRFK